MIEVVTPQSPYAGWTFDDVTKWHVDDSGHLHLQYPDKTGNAATFARGEWLAVVDMTTDPAAEPTRPAAGPRPVSTPRAVR